MNNKIFEEKDSLNVNNKILIVSKNNEKIKFLN